MRRRQPELHINHERWLVSYADFITLLFAFFVVMYSISQVNESKYRVLSNTLVNAFSQSPARTLNPIQVGTPSRTLDPSVITNSEQQRGSIDEQGEVGKIADLPALAQEFREQFADLVSNDIVQVHANEFWLEIELKSQVLFGSGESKPTLQAQDIFAEVAGMLKSYANPVQVEGFTDNIPIKTARFNSNWELSAARAAAIVELLAASGVAPERLSAVGYGEFQPVATNDTAAGRASNRRVVLMVAKERKPRPTVRDESGLDKALTEEPVAPASAVLSPATSTTATSTPATPNTAPGGANSLQPLSGLPTQMPPQAEPLTGRGPFAELLRRADSLSPPGAVEGNSQGSAPNAAQSASQTGNRSDNPLTPELPAVPLEPPVPYDPLAPVGDIKPVKTESGGLLFSSDPNARPR